GSKDDRGVHRLRWIVVGASYPLGAKLYGKSSMFFFSRGDDHLHSPMSRDLNTNVAGGSESVDGERVARAQVGETQRAESDDACAQQRRGFLIAKALGNRIDELLRRGQILGITAIHGPSGEQRIGTEILASARAVLTSSTSAMQPGHADAGSCRISLGGAARASDASDHLMSGNHMFQFGRKLTLRDVQIRAANAADAHFDQDFVDFGLRNWQFGEDERIVFDLGGMGECKGLHGIYCDTWRV